MNFNDWINSAIESGNLCGLYADKVNDAMSKKQLMDIVLDSNGVSYLLEMQEKGMGLPYGIINKEFAPFINGKYIASFHNEKGNGYTSKLYCCYTDNSEILADTTALVLLGCNNKVNVPENAFVKIFIDCNCDVEISCPKSAKCFVEFSRGAHIGIAGNSKSIELIDRGNGQTE